jgi:hypothetical protein
MKGGQVADTTFVPDDEIARHTTKFVDEVLATLTRLGATRKSTKRGVAQRVRVTTAHNVKQELGLQFVSVRICPLDYKTCFTADVVKLMDVFQSVTSCQVGNFQLVDRTERGMRKRPNLRFMGIYMDVIFLLDIYLRPVDMEK